MNIIELARQAGFNDFPNDKNGVWVTDGYRNEELKRFAELVAAAEREACAKLCEQIIKESEINYKESYFEKKQRLLCLEMIAIPMKNAAAAIRARGDMSTKSQNVDTSEERVQETDKSIHDLRKAAEMALEALETIRGEKDIESAHIIAKNARYSLREALAQPEQEPQRPVKSYTGGVPRYATDAPKPEWIGLMEEESSDIYNAHHNTYGECITSAYELVLDVEAKLKEKNNG